jgi:pyruvate kinase
MINNFLPSSSEGSDISNLVMEGIDSFMLIGETSYGAFPRECIKILNRISMETEKY